MENSSTQMNGSIQAGHGSKISSIGHERHARKKFNFKKLIKPAVIIFVVGLIIFGGFSLFKSATSSSIDESKYQAVFLTNGQVYFGKLHIKNGGYMILSNIYYLQSKTNTTSGDIQAAAGSNDTSVELVKLGSEIHGPVDQMVINVEQVLIFENLKSDGKVAQSIVQYEAQNH